MTHRSGYLMEGDEESIRLDVKTNVDDVQKQALWAGLKPGMRIADLGCGAGKTTFLLNKLVQPNGEAVGIDIAEQRITYAKKHYSNETITYVCRDIRSPLDDLDQFDLIWVRFVLEYYRSDSFGIVKNISKILKPGGIMCLIDLDCNCLRHFGLSERLENALAAMMRNLEKNSNFDPFVGVKLYSFLYDLGYENIDVNLTPHHLIFGPLKEADKYNWTKKVEIAGRNSGYDFEEYEGGYEEFFKEFQAYFSDLRRFAYTPLISCRGRKPLK